jgi:hypothetical protein
LNTHDEIPPDVFLEPEAKQALAAIAVEFILYVTAWYDPNFILYFVTFVFMKCRSVRLIDDSVSSQILVLTRSANDICTITSNRLTLGRSHIEKAIEELDLSDFVTFQEKLLWSGMKFDGWMRFYFCFSFVLFFHLLWSSCIILIVIDFREVKKELLSKETPRKLKLAEKAKAEGRIQKKRKKENEAVAGGGIDIASNLVYGMELKQEREESEDYVDIDMDS